MEEKVMIKKGNKYRANVQIVNWIWHLLSKPLRYSKLQYEFNCKKVNFNKTTSNNNIIKRYGISKRTNLTKTVNASVSSAFITTQRCKSHYDRFLFKHFSKCCWRIKAQMRSVCTHGSWWNSHPCIPMCYIIAQPRRPFTPLITFQWSHRCAYIFYAYLYLLKMPDIWSSSAPSWLNISFPWSVRIFLRSV